MVIGVFGKTYNEKNIEDLFKRISDDGIKNIQFNFVSVGLDPLPDKVDESLLDEINRVKNKYGICIDALTGTFNMIDPDVEARKQAISQFAYQCYLASRIEAPIITLCTGSKNTNKWAWDDKNLLASSYQELLDTTRQILVFAHKYNIILGVETEPSNVICNPNKARKYLDDIDDSNLKIVLDGANLFTKGNIDKVDETLIEAFKLLGKDVVSAHGKDVYIKDDKLVYCGSGKGIVNFKLFKQLLLENNYQGSIIMHGLADNEVKECKEYLENA